LRWLCRPASGFEFRQFPVHGVQIEMCRIKAAAAPRQEVLVRFVLRIRDRGAKVIISRGAADILWWAGVLAGEAVDRHTRYRRGINVLQDW
jgi:hypothetical protein